MAEHGKCRISRHSICFVCGNFTKLPNSQPFVSVIHLYTQAFDITLQNSFLDEWFVPTRVCGGCRVILYAFKDNKENCPLKKPAQWSLPTCANECYFCVSKPAFGRQKPVMAQVSSMKKPVYENKKVGRPIDMRKKLCTLLEPNESVKESSLSEPKRKKRKLNIQQWHEDPSSKAKVDVDYVPKELQYKVKNKKIKRWSQSEAVDFIKDARMPLNTGEVFISRMKESGFIDEGKVTELRVCAKNFEDYCTFDEKTEATVCTNHEGLIKTHFDKNYHPSQWRLFLDGNKKALVVCLLHNGNKKTTIPLALSKKSKEEYARIAGLLKLLNYKQNNWLVVGDLKMVAILQGIQGGRPTFSCPYCLWNSLEEDIDKKYDSNFQKRDPNALGKTQL